MRIKGTCWLAVQDIGGFTALSERLARKGKTGTEILTRGLQQFFTQAEKPIHHNDGYIFKLAGDAYYAIFPGNLKNARITSLADTLLNLPALRKSGLQTRFVAVKGEVEGDWIDLGFGNLDFVIKGPALYDLSIMEEDTPAGSMRIIEGAVGIVISQLPPMQYRRRKGEFVPAHRPLYVGFLQIPHDFKILLGVNEFIKEKNKEIRMLKWLPSARHFKGLFIAGFPESTGKEAAVILNLHASLRERFPDFTMKMGISSGMVYAGQLGGMSFREFSVIGDRVNVAARLLDIAPDMGIYFSGEIERSVKGKFTIQHIGATKLKGKEEMIEICQPVGKIMNVFESTLFPHRFVGRSAELEKIRSYIRRRKSCCVVADAGMGKSRVLYEIRRGLDHRGMIEVSMAPVSPPLSFLKDLLKHFPLGEYEDLNHFLQGTVKLDREVILKRLKQVLYLKPNLIVIIEDLHWLDETSFSFLRELLPLSFLIIASSRPDKEIYSRELSLHEVELPPLDGKSMMMLARDMLGCEPSSDLRDLLLDKSSGNPFYLEQLLVDLEERKLVKTDGGRADIAEDVSSMPFSIHSILLSRFNRLSVATQKIIEIAACLGREFTEKMLGKIAEEGEAHLQIALKEGILAQSRGIYLFQHALFREAILSSMLEVSRRHYERNISEVFIQERRSSYEIAYHLTAAGMIPDAAYHWVSAFNELYDRGLETEAARIIKMLMDSTDERTKPLGTLLSACQLTRAADYYDAEYMFKELKCNRDLRKEALFGLCSLHDWSGRYAKMKTSLDELDRCRMNVVEQVNFLELKGIYYDMSGDNMRGLACYRKTLELSRRHKLPRAMMTSLHNIGWIYIKLHELARARKCFNEALSLIPEGDLYNESTMLLRLGHIDNCEGNLMAARDHLLRSLKGFRKTAFPYWENLALLNLADNCVLSGDRAQAYRYAAKADDIARNLYQPADLVNALHLYYGEHKKFSENVRGKEKDEYMYYYLYLYSLGKPDDAEKFIKKHKRKVRTPSPEQLKKNLGPLHFISLYKKFVLPFKKRNK